MRLPLLAFLFFMTRLWGRRALPVPNVVHTPEVENASSSASPVVTLPTSAELQALYEAQQVVERVPPQSACAVAVEQTLEVVTAPVVADIRSACSEPHSMLGSVSSLGLVAACSFALGAAVARTGRRKPPSETALVAHPATAPLLLPTLSGVSGKMVIESASSQPLLADEDGGAKIAFDGNRHAKSSIPAASCALPGGDDKTAERGWRRDGDGRLASVVDIG